MTSRGGVGAGDHGGALDAVRRQVARPAPRGACSQRARSSSGRSARPSVASASTSERTSSGRRRARPMRGQRAERHAGDVGGSAVEHLGDRLDDGRQAGAGRLGRVAVAGQVGRDAAEVARPVARSADPGRGTGADAVQEQKRRPAAGAQDVQCAHRVDSRQIAGQLAAVDQVAGAGDEARGVAAQRGDEAAEVVGPAHRPVLDAELAGPAGVVRTGEDGVHRDALFGEGRRRALRPGPQRAARGRRQAQERLGRLHAGRRDDDDAAPAPLAHRHEAAADQSQRRIEGRVEGRREVGFARLERQHRRRARAC